MAIDGIIPQQNFELIRDRIAGILAVNLIEQNELGAIDYANGVDVEAYIPYDADTVYPIVNVVFSDGEYSNKDQTIVDGYYRYYIAAFVAKKTSASQKGDVKAAKYLGRLLGICRATLENPIYNRLLFAKPTKDVPAASFISTHVGAIKIPKFTESGDTENSIMGYLEYFVKVEEGVTLIEPIPLASSVTEIKLYLTDKGYRWGPDGDELDFYIASESSAEPNYYVAST